MAKIKPAIANNSTELFELLKLSKNDMVEAEFRSQLNSQIINLVLKSGLTHNELAEKIGSNRTRITALLNRSRSDISTDYMIKVLAALGYKVDFKIKKIA